MSNAILKLEKVNKTYHEGKEHLHIISDLDLTVKEGEFISILGKSGSGKTTLLNLLGMLDEADGGDIIYAGENIVGFSEAERNIKRNVFLGFVFQFHYLLPEFTALENVTLPAYVNKNADKKKVEAKAKELLKDVGLKDRMNHKPSELSGGEKQRVAIARAMINDPKVILADEPTGNLDEETSEVINNIMKKINKDKKQTIIVVTHSSELAAVCDKRYYLRKGRLEEERENL